MAAFMLHHSTQRADEVATRINSYLRENFQVGENITGIRSGVPCPCKILRRVTLEVGAPCLAAWGRERSQAHARCQPVYNYMLLRAVYKCTDHRRIKTVRCRYRFKC